MTKDKARKKAIRVRAAATGEPYSVAARNLDAPTPRCCEVRGLIYPDGRRRCWRHATGQDYALVTALDKRAAARGLRVDTDSTFVAPLNRLWPYGPNLYVATRIRMLDWAEEHDLRLSVRGSSCLHWLRKGRCAVSDCYSERAWWMDHVTCWIRGGKPAVFVAQPYELNQESRWQLAALDAEPNLRVEISPDAWYGMGTTFVGVWRTDTPIR